MKHINLANMKQELERDEKFKRKIYQCTAGKNTIGIGRNLDDVGIRRDEAEYMLVNDIKEAESYAMKYPWYINLDATRKRAIVNMMFNLGPSRFKGFKNAIKAMSVGDHVTAAAEFKDSRWYKQVGVRAKRVCYMIEHGKVKP